MTNYDVISKGISKYKLHIPKETMAIFLTCDSCVYRNKRTKLCDKRQKVCLKGRIQWLDKEASE